MFCKSPWEDDEMESYKLGKIFINHVGDRRFVSRIHKNIENSLIKMQLNQKMDKEYDEQTFHRREYTDSY